MAVTINASTSAGLVQTADTSGVLQLQTASTTAVTVDASQNVGIGTTSPLGKLNVSSASFGGTVSSNGNQIVVENSGNAGITIASGASSAGNIFFADSGDTADGYVQYDQSGRSMRFGTATAERMRIDSSGNVNIGQSSAFASSIRTTIKAADTSSQSLALVSAVTSGTGTLQYLVDGSNDVCGYIGINATANTTSYNTSSDYRLKENIISMTGALDKVSKLKPVLWNWKHAPEVIGQGFIAHELAEVIPDAVSGEKDAVDDEGKPVYQGVDTSFLIATLTAAIQEQQTIINDLKARITALEGAA
jgi:hypothetical protein